MKALSIGREQGCDIVINDSTDVISRRHAILNISSSGKITIVDQSRNGTYVNGIRISQNVPVPVTRKDIISFAHVAKLDWNAVPASGSAMRYSILGFVGILLIAGGIFGYMQISDNPEKDNNQEVVVTDSTNIKKDIEDKKDSTEIKKDKQDTDSVKSLRKKSPKTDKKTEKEKEEKKETVAPKDSIKNKNNRPIG